MCDCAETSIVITGGAAAEVLMETGLAHSYALNPAQSSSVASKMARPKNRSGQEDYAT